MSIIPSLFEEGKQPENTSPEVKETTEVQLAENEVALKIQASVKKAETNWPVIKESSVKAQAALSGIIKIENDEDDAKAEEVVKKVIKTYAKVSALRLEITTPLDEIKEKVMQPEKFISNLKGHAGESHLTRVVNLRNTYATEKLQKQRKAEADALAKQNEEFEISKIKADVQTIFNQNVLDYAANAEIAMTKFFNNLQLVKDNPEKPEEPISWEQQIKKFNLTPKLKETTFNEWFDVPYDEQKLSVEKYKEVIEGIKALYTYELINKAYVTIAQPKIDDFKAKLPAKKKELEDMAALQLKDKKAAEKLRLKQEAENQQKIDKINSDAALEKEKAAKEVKKQQNNENLGASFETLNVTQNQEELKIKRIPILTEEDPQKVFDAMAKVLFHCFSKADKFVGVFKKDGKTDENGMPEYTPWAKTLLSFVADNTEAQIEGITFKEIAVAKVARDKKEKAE